MYSSVARTNLMTAMAPLVVVAGAREGIPMNKAGISDLNKAILRSS